MIISLPAGLILILVRYFPAASLIIQKLKQPYKQQRPFERLSDLDDGIHDLAKVFNPVRKAEELVQLIVERRIDIKLPFNIIFLWMFTVKAYPPKNLQRRATEISNFQKD